MSVRFMKDYKKRVLDAVQDDIIILEDGYSYYMPSKAGAFSASSLRIIAAELDLRNKCMDIAIKQYYDCLDRRKE